MGQSQRKNPGGRVARKGLGKCLIRSVDCSPREIVMQDPLPPFPWSRLGSWHCFLFKGDSVGKIRRNKAGKAFVDPGLQSDINNGHPSQTVCGRGCCLDWGYLCAFPVSLDLVLAQAGTIIFLPPREGGKDVNPELIQTQSQTSSLTLPWWVTWGKLLNLSAPSFSNVKRIITPHRWHK